MNNKLVNILFVISGFLAHLFLVNSPEWNIVGIIGLLISGISGVGAVNLLNNRFPNTGTYKDWLFPTILLVIFGLISYFVRTNGYFGTTGTVQSFINTTITVITAIPLFRLYIYLVHYRKNL